MSFVLTNRRPDLRRSGLTVGRLLLFILAVAAVSMPLAVRAQEVPAGLTIHVVQRDENLFRISLRYGTSVDELARLNGITDVGSIQVGQRILVPLVAGEPPPLAGDAGAQIPPAQPSEALFHTVLAGETLFRIATQYGVSVEAVMAANSLSDATLIFPGQTLLIPGVQPPQLDIPLPPAVTSLVVQPQVFNAGHTAMARLVTEGPSTVTGSLLGLTSEAGTDSDRLVHTLLFGLPTDTPAGTYTFDISVDTGSGAQPIAVPVEVTAGFFVTESLTIPEDRLALISADVDAAEAETVRAFMSGHSQQRWFDGMMGLPASAAMTSPFGSTRSYNGGVLQRLHLGVDFAAPPGASIFAPSGGVVVFSGPLEVRGLATIIDHGWGVYSGYWHQTQSFVTPGAQVVSGQIIGTVGMSGRVTGPHLHWELWVNGVPVDPMQWVQQSFAP